MRRLPLFLLLLCLLALPHGTAQADDSPNTKRLMEVPISDAPSYAKRALVIGIDQYEHFNSFDGSPCTQDARAFANVLKSKFGFADVVLMTQDSPSLTLRPTGRHIKDSLKALYAGLNSDCEVVVFYSGHGTRAVNKEGIARDYLVPSDCDADDLAGSSIDYEAVRSQIEGKNPRRTLIITDACRNLRDTEGHPKGMGDGKGFGGAGEQPLTDPQIAELRSCLPGQYSEVGKDFPGSVFTHYLLMALQGDPEAAVPNTNQVTFDSLKRFVQGRVSQYVASQYNDVQTPTGLATLGEMMLARVAVEPPVKRILTAAEQKAANARLFALWEDDWGDFDKEKAKSFTSSDIRVALAVGADVNARDKDGGTALGYATNNNTVETVKALLTAGADVNAKDNYGSTVLFSVAGHGRVEMVRVLLAAGVNVNVKNKYGNTALFYAENPFPDDKVPAAAQANIIAALKAAGATE